MTPRVSRGFEVVLIFSNDYIIRMLNKCRAGLASIFPGGVNRKPAQASLRNSGQHLPARLETTQDHQSDPQDSARPAQDPGWS
jgi:hypothetical protein